MTATSAAIAALLADYYGSPASLASFQVAAGRLSAESGYFKFGPETICYGRSAAPSVCGQAAEARYDALPDVVLGDGVVRLTMDPHEVVDNLRHERYARPPRRGRGRIGESSTVRHLYYHCLRPFLPVGVRKHLQRLHLSDWREIVFPQWPVDATVDRVFERLLALSMQAQGVTRLPFIWFWPDGAQSAAIMTHDVEGVSGRNFCSRLMDLDDAVGVKSSFQIVPEKRYTVPASLLEEIRTRGFEVNIHDLNHDGRLFSSHARFLSWVQRLNEYGRSYGAQGFRSGGLYRNQAWYDALDFAYDMSVPSSAHLEPQRGGCCSVMPFFIGRILELPLTTTQDYSLFHILNDYSIDLWTRQLQAIGERHGLASFIVHPDYILEPRARGTYERLLAHLARLREEQQLWIARPQEVNDWWRARRQMTLLHDGTAWVIEGPQKSRARVAYAVLAGDTVSVEVTSPESTRADSHR